MARPIEYDKSEVLTKAMEIFWRQGYDSTSMKDLVEATGLTTRSMYNIFESKNGLFRASLEWYYDKTVKWRYDRLLEENGLEAIKNFMDVIAARRSRNGCLFVNTVSDRANIEDSCLDIVEDYFYKLEHAFIEKLTYAKEHEGYEDDPILRAKQLVVVIKGLSVHSKDVKALEENNRIVNDFMDLMKIH